MSSVVSPPTTAAPVADPFPGYIPTAGRYDEYRAPDGSVRSLSLGVIVKPALVAPLRQARAKVSAPAGAGRSAATRTTVRAWLRSPAS